MSKLTVKQAQALTQSDKLHLGVIDVPVAAPAAPKSRKAKAQPTATATSALAASIAGILAAPAPAPAATPKTRSAPDLTLVVAKEFKPRTNHITDGDKGRWAQQANWDALVAAIQAHGGKITYAQAVQAVADNAKANGFEATANARGFVQGRVRNGHIKAA
jgi:hypothetical protein